MISAGISSEMYAGSRIYEGGVGCRLKEMRLKLRGDHAAT